MHTHTYLCTDTYIHVDTATKGLGGGPSNTAHCMRSVEASIVRAWLRITWFTRAPSGFPHHTESSTRSSREFGAQGLRVAMGSDVNDVYHISALSNESIKVVKNSATATCTQA